MHELVLQYSAKMFFRQCSQACPRLIPTCCRLYYISCVHFQTSLHLRRQQHRHTRYILHRTQPITTRLIFPSSTSSTSSSNTSPEHTGIMTRSFSLAPGGWVGDMPGRSGETWHTEQEAESKLFTSSSPQLCTLLQQAYGDMNRREKNRARNSRSAFLLS
jgi:hypothetical protein